MRELIKLKEGSLLFYDIETAPLVKELEPNTPLYDSWEYKKSKDGVMEQDEVIKTYSEEAGLYPEFARIVCISVGKIIKGKITVFSFNDSDEKTLLEKFNKLLERNVKDTLVGFVNVGFDSPFVFKRMIINGIDFSDKIDSSGLKPWEVEEVDLAKVWQGTSFSRASLINIAVALGLPSPKEDISGKDVGTVYWENPEGNIGRITEYCERDVVTTINVFRKMRLQEPLEVEVKPIESKPLSMLERLYEGGRFTSTDKEKLVEFLKDYPEEDQERALTVLGAIVSRAKGKKTKITKAHLTSIKKELDAQPA